MAGLIQIRSELFIPVQRLTDYEIYRDGFCLWVKNNRTRQGYLIKHVDIAPMLLEIMPLKLVIIPQKLIEAVLTKNQELTVWAIPTDEKIIQYCIDKALIPHPFDAYN